MPVVNTKPTSYAIERARVELAAMKCAKETGQTYLVFVCPKTGQIDAIQEAERWQIGEATVLRRIVPDLRRAKELRSDCYPDPAR